MESRRLAAIKSNIWKYYLYCFFVLFVFFEPILFVYFQKNLNFSLTQIMILVAFFTIFIAFFELPTGVIGDKLGYKKTMLLGAFCILLGSIGYAFSTDFHHILIAEFFWALGFSFNSGTQDAFLYDTLKNLGEERRYKKINGGANAAFWSGLAVSSILGGLLAKTDLGLPVFLSFFPLFIPIIIVLTFKEPERKFSTLTHLQHTLESLRYILLHKKLRFLVFYLVVLVLILDSSYKFFQPYMNEVGINIAWFGLVFAFGYLFSGLGALISDKLDKVFGEKKLLYLIYIVAFIALLFLSQTNSAVGLVGVFILLILDGVRTPAITDYLHANIESHNRATVTSIANLSKTIVLAATLPVLGYLGDLYSTTTVFFIDAVIIILSFIIIKSWYKKI